MQSHSTQTVMDTCDAAVQYTGGIVAKQSVSSQTSVQVRDGETQMECKMEAAGTQTETTKTTREANPLSEWELSNVQNAAFRARLQHSSDGTEVSDGMLLDRYQEESEFEDMPAQKLRSIRALLRDAYEREVLAEIIEKNEVLQGSMGEIHMTSTDIEGEGSQANTEIQKAACKGTVMDGTAILLLRMQRKDREIWSKEPKIPW